MAAMCARRATAASAAGRRRRAGGAARGWVSRKWTATDLGVTITLSYGEKLVETRGKL